MSIQTKNTLRKNKCFPARKKNPIAHLVYVRVVRGSVAPLHPVALVGLPKVQVLAPVEEVDLAQVVRVQLAGVHRVQGEAGRVVLLQRGNLNLNKCLFLILCEGK